MWTLVTGLTMQVPARMLTPRDGKITSGHPMSRMIIYTCPKTGRDVSSGVLTDEDSFARLPHEKVTVNCSECGDVHEYWTSEARLAPEPAPTNKPTGAG